MAILQALDLAVTVYDNLGPNLLYKGPKVYAQISEAYFLEYQAEYDLKKVTINLEKLKNLDHTPKQPPLTFHGIFYDSVKNQRSRKKRLRCKTCPSCLAPKCMVCKNCLTPNLKKSCIDRKCSNLKKKPMLNFGSHRITMTKVKKDHKIKKLILSQHNSSKVITNVKNNEKDQYQKLVCKCNHMKQNPKSASNARRIIIAEVKSGHRIRKRCKKCTGCLAPKCGACKPCLNLQWKKSCINRKCLSPKPPDCPCFSK